jgi:cytochrome c553
MQIKFILSGLVLGLIAQTGLAADYEAGKQKATGVCAHCHGTNGISSSDQIPNLQGQKAEYLKSALKAYQEGTRKAPIMNNMAVNLSEQDMDNVAAYFSGLKP